MRRRSWPPGARRRAGLLALAAATYALAAWMVAPGFYDGFVQQGPYHWVDPPPGVRNLAPGGAEGGRSSFRVAGTGLVDPGTVFTGDGQFSISWIPGALATPADRSPVTVTITAAAGSAPPGVQWATNAYCATASSPVAAGREVLVSLSFSDQTPAPGDVYQAAAAGAAWTKIGSTGTSAPFSISARTGSLGCWMAGYPANASATASGPRLGGGQLLPIIVAGAIVIVLLAGIPLALTRRGGGAEEPGPEPEPEPEPEPRPRPPSGRRGGG